MREWQMRTEIRGRYNEEEQQTRNNERGTTNGEQRTRNDEEREKDRINTRAQAQITTTPHHHVSCLRPPARPQAAGPANLSTTHRPDGATSQDEGSPAARALRLRATSMRPRESEGAAAGGDDDDDGAVRSEGSGPQSWARAASGPAPPGDLRRQHLPQQKQQRQRRQYQGAATRSTSHARGFLTAQG